jgi:hypothetical protein
MIVAEDDLDGLVTASSHGAVTVAYTSLTTTR